MDTDKEDKIARFGYDPAARLVYIGKATVAHRGNESEFEFYYNAASRKIDVCYFGCNGTYISGVELDNTTTTLPLEFSSAFFEVKSRVPKGYSFMEKPWIGRIVAVLKKTPPGYKSGPLHFDVYFDDKSGSIDVHSVGCCSPMFRAIINPDGSTTLPEELHDICKNLCIHPQSSIDEHNANCEECRSAIRKRRGN